MNYFYISYSFIILLSLLVQNESKSDEYYDCMNSDKTIYLPIFCTTKKIPVANGYKCCSMGINYGNSTSYNCFAIETEYTKDVKTLDEYISKRNLDFLFISTGGQISIDCGGSLIVKKTYKKYSEPFLNCYKGNIQGVENANDCIENDIPEEENSKCCYIEKAKMNGNGNVTYDKRCYIVDKRYFSGKKNLKDYILEESNFNNLDDIKNYNIIIKSKDYDAFYVINIEDTSFENHKKKKPGLSWLIILFIVFGCILFLIGVIFTVYCFINKRKVKISVNPGSDGPNA